MKETNVYDLIDRYEAILFDAYGVLVNAGEACTGAVALIDDLNRREKPYWILTNDASKLPESSAAKLLECGLCIPAERIITSGGLLKSYFAAHDLAGARCVVLGPKDSSRYAELAGGQVVSHTEPFDVLIVADESGFPFLKTVDSVLSALFEKADLGQTAHLLLPNPDLVYPKADRAFGITAGSIALMFEAALESRYPNQPGLRFTRLGKPHAPLFWEAIARCESRDLVMIGDQLDTDIKGAKAVGLDTALVAGGVSRVDGDAISAELMPTFMLRSLER